MPIPAGPYVPDGGGWDQNPLIPVPVDWQRTFVSITGSNGEGEEIPLTGFTNGAWPAIVLQPGVSGLDMPPFDLHTDDSPNLDGSSFRGVRAAARQILLPVYVYGIDRKTLRSFKRRLANALNPKNGFCLLTFIEQDGVARRIKCYYANGMEGNEAVGAAGFTYVSYGIQLNAVDPWFYGDTEVVANWSFGQPHPFLGNPFLPLQLNSGTPASGTLIVENPGDIEAWPVWTITGPLKSFSFTGPAVPQPAGATPKPPPSWGIPAQPGGADCLATGRTLTVDCRPGYKTITDDQGTNYFPLMSANPELWSVPPGISTVQANLVSGSGTPTVKMELLPRYATY
ncbi:phage tail family protein [Streptomyces argyrophyllae]|uniref:Phage tail family protein n=1 Tax=Streptomyces argyrophylli TaxID=2726118 RepID=A0A6M4PJH9_9ACTN|nr:phage tail domain-containing protein [Streptomyces argyrophyllae]QJS09100.1 phage tail family protein [Streptomyces argyrophyllae]